MSEQKNRKNDLEIEPKEIDVKASEIAGRGLLTSGQIKVFREAVIQGLLAGRIKPSLGSVLNTHVSGIVKVVDMELRHGGKVGATGVKSLDFKPEGKS